MQLKFSTACEECGSHGEPLKLAASIRNPQSAIRNSKIRNPSRRGAVVVEFAICVPLLLMIFFASLEFSRVNMIRQSAENAAYEGARRGIVPGATAADVQAAAQSVLDTVSTNSATVTVTPSTITDDTTEVTVDISIPINANSWVTPFFFKDRTVDSSLTLFREQFDTTSAP